MATHAALLRGINVGGHSALRMADLRDVAATLGLTDVETYVQSGNLVFSSPATDTLSLALDLEQAIAAATTAAPAVVLLTRDELLALAAGDPYADEPDPKRVHVVVVRGGLGEADAAEVGAAVERARAKGSRDRGAVVGGALWLHTPDGIGRSALAAQLSRPRTDRVATARNRSTLHRLVAMLG